MGEPFSGNTPARRQMMGTFVAATSTNTHPTIALRLSNRWVSHGTR